MTPVRGLPCPSCSKSSSREKSVEASEILLRLAENLFVTDAGDAGRLLAALFGDSVQFMVPDECALGKVLASVLEAC